MNRKHRAEGAVPVHLLQKAAAFLYKRRITPVLIRATYPVVRIPGLLFCLPAVRHQHRHPRIPADRRIKLCAALLVLSPDEGELLLVEAAEIAAHRAVQRNVLTRIVQHAQILDDLADLLRLKISGPRRHITGHAVFLKHAPEILIPARGRPEQDHDIAVPRGPERVRLLIRDRIMPHEFPDPEGDRLCLDAPAAVALLLFLLRAILRVPLRAAYHQQLRSRLRARRKRSVPGLQCGSLVILHAADLRSANMTENRVDRIQHLGAGPEIPVEINPLVLRIIRAEGAVFFHEDLRPREPELVDTLLDVPDHEPVPLPLALARDHTEQQLLHIVGILIFIAQDFGKMRAVCLRSRSRVYFAILSPSAEDPKREMLEIVEVDDVLLLFCCGVGFHQLFC